MRGAVLLGTLLAVQAELTPTEQFNLIKLGFIKKQASFRVSGKNSDITDDKFLRSDLHIKTWITGYHLFFVNL